MLQEKRPPHAFGRALAHEALVLRRREVIER
jgi:hypothetical protein